MVGGKISQNVTGVGRPGTALTNTSSTPRPASAACTNRPKGSSPVLVMTADLRPCLAAATATLVALPLRNRPNDVTCSSATPAWSGYKSTPTRPIVSTS